MDWVIELLPSLVSATTLVASAVAVMVAPPLVAVHVPVIATVAVAPAAMEAVLVFSVVLPTATRVTVVAPDAEVPRLFTETVKLTAAPTAGLAGLVVIAVTCRSGPGAWVTVRLLAA